MYKFDYYRFFGKYPCGIKDFFKGMSVPGICFMYFFRKGSSAKRKSISWILYRLVLRHLSYKFGFQIPLNTRIGKGFYIGHFGSIIISPNAVIGDNCNVTRGVTIGMSYGKRLGAPRIGECVWMGMNSTITGNISIGNNVLIAPGAFVNFDVPDHSIVIGNPGKIISKEEPVKDYVQNIV